MDKYLIKIPKGEQPGLKKKTPAKRMVQSTIESMKGVVVIDDLMRMKSKLILPNQSSAVMVECLHTLGQKTPGRDILKDTGLGRVVNKLRKHTDTDVSSAACSLYSRWKHVFRERLSRPQIEVRYDKDTMATRSCAKKFISRSLQVEATSELVDCIEREIFHRCDKLLSVSYKRTTRCVTFALKKPSLRESILSGETSVEELVSQCKR